MQIRWFKLPIIIALFSFTFGCSGSQSLYKETALDKSWGRSVESAKFAQALNPDAGTDSHPVEGLDGRASETNVFKYLKSFEKDSERPLRYESTAGGTTSK